MKKVWLGLAAICMFALCPVLLIACGETPATLTLEQPFKTEYNLGEELDVSSGILKICEKGEEKFVSVDASMVSGFSSNSFGSREMVISYQDKSIKINYTIKVPELIEGLLYSGEIVNAEKSTAVTIKFYESGNDLDYDKVYYYQSGETSLDSVNCVYEVNKKIISDNSVQYSLRCNLASNDYYNKSAKITMIDMNSFIFEMVGESPITFNK